MRFYVSFKDDSNFPVDFSEDSALTTNFGEVTIVPIGGEPYRGDYDVEPDFIEQTLQTKNKLLKNDVKVFPIRVSETSNPYGTTVYIGRAING